MSNGKQERIISASIRVLGFHVEPASRFGERIDYKINGANYKLIRSSEIFKDLKYVEIKEQHEGFITTHGRFVDPKEAMGIAIKAEQVGGILWKKVEARMLNDCGFIDRSKVKRKAIDETIKNYLEFPLMPEDLY